MELININRKSLTRWQIVPTIRELILSIILLFMGVIVVSGQEKLSKDDEIQANKHVLLQIICYNKAIPEIDDPQSSVEFMSNLVYYHCERKIDEKVRSGQLKEVVAERVFTLLGRVRNNHIMMIAEEIVAHRGKQTTE